MEGLWLLVLMVSIILLVTLLLKAQWKLKWFGFAFIQFLLAGLIVYGINGLGILDQIHIPINLTSMFTIACLGLPGLVLIISVKWFVL